MKKKNWKFEKKSLRIPDPEDSWARVEMYRWEHGELPMENVKSLNESKALLAIADAIEKGCKSGNLEEIPSPFNLCSVLRYVAKKI